MVWEEEKMRMRNHLPRVKRSASLGDMEYVCCMRRVIARTKHILVAKINARYTEELEYVDTIQ